MRRVYVQGAAQAFQKFAVDSDTANHIMELAGLGMLSVPVLNHLLGDPDNDSPTKKRVMAGTELAGLGTLAYPAVNHLIHK